jgi:hypothetical protein
MRQSAFRHLVGAAVAAAAAIAWTSSAVAAPGGGRLCNAARAWMEGHCDGSKASRVATPERCAKARGWLDAHCSGGKAEVQVERTYRNKEDVVEERAYRGKVEVTDERAYRSKVMDDRDYKPARPHKHANKARKRVVYVHVERSRACCYSEPMVYYRTSPYRDQVFVTDHVLSPGKEAPFFRALESSKH